MASPRRRLLAVLVVGLLPWTVVAFGRQLTLVFSFGLVTLDPLHLTNLYDYLFVYTDGLPRRLQAWPAGVVLHVAALASALGGLRGLEDPRLTAGLLAVAGFAHLQVSVGLYRQGLVVLPLGALCAWLVTWWYYWPLVRGSGESTRQS